MKTLEQDPGGRVDRVSSIGRVDGTFEGLNVERYNVVIWVGGWAYPAIIPPSTGMTAPVIHADASESRNAIAFATSSG